MLRPASRISPQPFWKKLLKAMGQYQALWKRRALSSLWDLFCEMLLMAHLYKAASGILLHNFLYVPPRSPRQRDGGKVWDQAVRFRSPKAVWHGPSFVLRLVQNLGLL